MAVVSTPHGHAGASAAIATRIAAASTTSSASETPLNRSCQGRRARVGAPLPVAVTRVAGAGRAVVVKVANSSGYDESCPVLLIKHLG